MIRDTHVRRALVCIGATAPLVAVWVLAYQAGAGTNTIPLVPVVLGLAAGVFTVIVAVLTAGYPTDRRPSKLRNGSAASARRNAVPSRPQRNEETPTERRGS